MSNSRFLAGARQPVIDCQHLAKTYAQDLVPVEVLTDVNLQVMPGEKLAIVGVSGSGKSTLLHLLGGLDIPTNGHVKINGRNMGELSDANRGRLRNEALGFIYQFHHLLPEFTALENVAMPLLIRGFNADKAAYKAEVLLERVGLSARMSHKPSELSGGERQRVAIARALITEPKVVLADEPTGNLDRKTADQVLELMVRLNKGMYTSLLVVTHDTLLASKMDTVYRLQDGMLIEQ